MVLSKTDVVLSLIFFATVLTLADAVDPSGHVEPKCNVSGAYDNGVVILSSGNVFAGMSPNGIPICAGTLRDNCTGVMNLANGVTLNFMYVDSASEIVFSNGGGRLVKASAKDPIVLPSNSLPASEMHSTLPATEAPTMTPSSSPSTFLANQSGYRGSHCIRRGGSCNPQANSCCQGPTLNSCRFRPFPSGLHGMAFTCGPDVRDAKQNTKTCVIEGDSCDSHGSTCCQVDADKRLTCQEQEPESNAYVCARAWVAPHTCTPKGQGCNPLANSCCQDKTRLSDLMACHLGSVSSEADDHGFSYTCTQEFS